MYVTSQFNRSKKKEVDSEKLILQENPEQVDELLSGCCGKGIRCKAQFSSQSEPPIPFHHAEQFAHCTPQLLDQCSGGRYRRSIRKLWQLSYSTPSLPPPKADVKIRVGACDYVIWLGSVAGMFLL